MLRFLPWIVHILAVALVVYVFLLSLNPVRDSDFWFHLKYGELISTEHRLPPAVDPFSYTTGELHGAVLKGVRLQWLSQALLWQIYRVGGLRGVAVVRSLLVVTPFALMYVFFMFAGRRLTWRWHAGKALAALMLLSLPLLLAGLVFSDAFERPQAASFVLMPVLLWLLLRLYERDDTQGQPRRQQLLLWGATGALMALWANLHGGVMVGVLFLLGVLVISVLQMGLPALGIRWRFAAGDARALAVASVAGIVASGFTPVGYHALRSVMTSLGLMAKDMTAAPRLGRIMYDVIEYKPVWFFSETLGQFWPWYLYALYALCAVLVVLPMVVSTIHTKTMKGVSPVRLLMLALLLVLGLSYKKGVMFAVPGLCVLSLMSLSELLNPACGRAARRVAYALCAGIVIAALLMVVSIGRTSPWNLDPHPPEHWPETWAAPEQALQFLTARKVQGPMFNYLAWGGYLIWRTQPEYPVFFDGRELDTSLTEPYLTVVNGAPGWQGVLDRYKVNFILIPMVHEANGEVSPLLYRILMQGDAAQWVPVYARSNALILLRRDERNAPVLECCELSVRDVAAALLQNTQLMMLSAGGGTAGALQLNQALAYYWLGNMDSAQQSLAGQPLTPVVVDLLSRIEYQRLLKQ